MKNNIFSIIDFTLKKTKIDISEININNFYLINRWLSMSDPNIAVIVNTITNRWCLNNKNIDILKFYRIFLPKITKSIKYIKKSPINKELEDKDLSKIANNFEISTREVEIYEEMFDFLSMKTN